MKNYDDTLYPPPSGPMLQTMRNQLGGLLIFIADEISMNSLCTLWFWHLRLNWSKGNVREENMVDFGGYRMGFIGDFFQLKPSGSGDAIYTTLAVLKAKRREANAALDGLEPSAIPEERRKYKDAANRARISVVARECVHLNQYSAM